MIVIRVIATLLAFVMAGAIAWATIGGSFSAEGETILALRWGVVSLIDVYVGASLVAVWIWWRDGWRSGLTWIVLLAVLGHLATAGYIAWRAWTTDSPKSLILGPHATV